MSDAVLFIERDGALIEAPADQQLDALGKLRFMPGVFAALAELRRRGYRLVMLGNPDGPGGASPAAAHEFMLNTFRSQGIEFEAVIICSHLPHERCGCREPGTGLLEQHLREHGLDREASAVIGAGGSKPELAAQLQLRGFTVRRAGGAHETWPAVLAELGARRARIVRHTAETAIEVQVNLDAAAPLAVASGIGFFDHMLMQLAKHGGFALELSCRGDLQVDEHHTVEDCALALGAALRRALGSKAGIARYGFLLPMDESEAQVALDLSGRPFARFDGRFMRESVGALPTELVPHFFRSLAESLGAALHVRVAGENTHHMIEACFKCVGRALRHAMQLEGSELPSTKGAL